MNMLRFLDIDDLLILRHLYQGNTLASAARFLGITPAAVTQRLRKIEGVFTMPQIVERRGRHGELTEQGRGLCERISQLVDALQQVGSDLKTAPR